MATLNGLTTAPASGRTPKPTRALSLASGPSPPTNSARRAGRGRLTQHRRRRRVDGKRVAAQHRDELHGVLAPERRVRRHPGRRLAVALVLIGPVRRPRCRLAGSLANRSRMSSVQNRAPRSHASASGTMWSICTAAPVCLPRVKATSRWCTGSCSSAGRHGGGASLDRHVGLVDEIAVEDVVAGVAAVVAAGCGVVVGPAVAERSPPVVVAADAQRDHGDAGEHVDAGRDGRDVGAGDELRSADPTTSRDLNGDEHREHRRRAASHSSACGSRLVQVLDAVGVGEWRRQHGHPGIDRSRSA